MEANNDRVHDPGSVRSDPYQGTGLPPGRGMRERAERTHKRLQTRISPMSLVRWRIGSRDGIGFGYVAGGSSVRCPG